MDGGLPPAKAGVDAGYPSENATTHQDIKRLPIQCNREALRRNVACCTSAMAASLGGSNSNAGVINSSG